MAKKNLYISDELEALMNRSDKIARTNWSDVFQEAVVAKLGLVRESGFTIKIGKEVYQIPKKLIEWGEYDEPDDGDGGSSNNLE